MEKDTATKKVIVKTAEAKKGSDNKKSDGQGSSSNIFIIPLCLLIAVAPLIVRYKEFNTHYGGNYWYLANENQTDVFLYWRHIFITACLAVMAVALIITLITNIKAIKKPPVFMWAIAIYALFAFLSTVFSKYSYWGFNGAAELFETVWILMGYALIIFYCYFFINRDSALKMIIYSFLGSSIIIMLIGALQVLGKDVYTKSWFQKLIGVDGIKLSIKMPVYSTLYNPNYFCFYLALIIPLLFYLFLFDKNIIRRLLYLVDFALCAICMYGSASASAFIAVGAEMVFSLFFTWRLFAKHKGITFSLVGIVAVAAIALIVSGKFSTIVKHFYEGDSKGYIDYSQFPLQDITVEENDIKIRYKEHDLRFWLLPDDSMGTCFFNYQVDESNDGSKSMILLPEKNYFVLEEAEFSEIYVQPKIMDSEYYSFVIHIEDEDWWFAVGRNDYVYHYLHTPDFSVYNIDPTSFNVESIGKFAPIGQAPFVLFKDYPLFMTNRGFIWGHTIPLLKDYIVLGNGPDSFVHIFPMYNYVENYNYSKVGVDFSKEISMLTMKPHCMYLQIWAQTGLLSLIAFMVFYFWYFFTSVKIYFFEKYEDFRSVVGVIAFIGSVGYMVAALANDSTIAVSPVFWVILGMGIAINASIKKQQKEKEGADAKKI